MIIDQVAEEGRASAGNPPNTPINYKNTNTITEIQIHKVVAQVQGPHHLPHQPFLLLLLWCVSPPTDPGAQCD